MVGCSVLNQYVPGWAPEQNLNFYQDAGYFNPDKPSMQNPALQLAP